VNRLYTIEKAGRNSDRIREYKEIVSQNKAVALQATAELKQGYIILDKEITGIKQEIAEVGREIQSLMFKAEKIDERTKNIQTMENRLEELKAQRQSMGIFKNKKFIDDEIGRFKNSCKQAENAFKKDYFVPPEEAPKEIKRLGYKAKDFERIQERLQAKLIPLAAEKDVFAFEYQRQNLLAGISPDGQTIQDELKRLDKKEMLGLSAKEKISHMRSERVIDIVTERSFQRILDEVLPEQQRKLIKQRERERAREHDRARCR